MERLQDFKKHQVHYHDIVAMCLWYTGAVYSRGKGSRSYKWQMADQATTKAVGDFTSVVLIALSSFQCFAVVGWAISPAKDRHHLSPMFFCTENRRKKSVGQRV